MRNELSSVLSANFPDLELTAEHWPTLARYCHVRRLARLGVVFGQGDVVPALYAVVTGEIEIQFSSLDGQVSVLEHVGAGGLFGLASFATGLPSAYVARASRASRLVAIDARAYEYLMDEVPGFARALMRELARRHHDALELLEASRHRSAVERLSLAIAKLVQSGRARERDARGRVLVRATQAELAALANLSRQTTNELIAELARQKRVESVYGGLWVTVTT